MLSSLPKNAEQINRHLIELTPHEVPILPYQARSKLECCVLRKILLLCPGIDHSEVSTSK